MKTHQFNLKWFCVVMYCWLLASGKVLQGQTAETLAAIDEIQKGDNLMKSLQWPEALMAYDNAIATDPNFANAYAKKAGLLAKLGRTQEAKVLFDKALLINPYSAYIYDGRAKLRMLSSDYKGALTDLDSAMAQDGGIPEFRDHLIDDLIALELYERAHAELDSLIKAGYEVAKEMEKKALVYLLQQDFDACLQTVESILEKDDRSAFAYDLKALVLLTKNMPGSAIQLIDKALTIDPSMVMAYHNRAIAHRMMGNNDRALQDLNTALEIRQDLERVFYSRAVIQKEMGKMNDALADYDRALRINDEFELAIYNRAYTLKLLGNYTGAMMDVNELLATDPQSRDALNLKANLMVLNAQYEDAILLYDQALRLDPEFAMVHYNRGLAKLMSNRFEDGCYDLRVSLDLGYSKALSKLTSFCDQ